MIMCLILNFAEFCFYKIVVSKLMSRFSWTYSIADQNFVYLCFNNISELKYMRYELFPFLFSLLSQFITYYFLYFLFKYIGTVLDLSTSKSHLLFSNLFPIWLSRSGNHLFIVYSATIAFFCKSFLLLFSQCESLI